MGVQWAVGVESKRRFEYLSDVDNIIATASGAF